MNNTNQPVELLRFDNVALGYGQRRILHDVNFTVVAGDYLGIVGANGAGKTTLLRGLLGLAEGSANPAGMKATSSPASRVVDSPCRQRIS